MKAVLALLLAKATCQFYDSALIGEGLTKDNIHFLYEERDSTRGVYLNEPMLLTRFEDDEKRLKDAKDIMSTTMIHDMPKILALGILLLELEMSTSMEAIREENRHLCPDGPVNINTNYKIVKRFVDKDDPEYMLGEISVVSPFPKVLPMCIMSGELRRKLDETLIAESMNASSRVDVSNALRAVIYSNVVSPLEEWVNTFHKPKTVKVSYKLAHEGARMPPRKVEPSQVTQSAPQTNTCAGNDDEEKPRRESDVWFERYEELMDVLQPQEGETGTEYKSVKIAVLDTGIKPDDHQYYLDYGTIKDYKDYTGQEGGACDVTGHGSAAVTLLIKTCRNASLYVARVLKTNTATPGDIQNVVEAIDWAIDHGVDIITMAIGFKEDQPLIAKAIERARGKQILIFSAASNGRNIDPIYFPAKRTDQVFGIFSTNAGIRESRSLNPSPNGRPHGFAIFGEGVKLPEVASLLRGTSYSTSIAAGLAAMLLDFARQWPPGDAEGRLREMQGMTKVFRKMAKLDGKYACICPWSILKNEFKTVEWDKKTEMRKRQREWIRGTIDRWLENVYEDLGDD